MQSQNVLCCGARNWALVLGWIQAISSGVLNLMCIVFLIFHLTHTDSGRDFEPLLPGHENMTNASVIAEESETEWDHSNLGALAELIVLIILLTVSTAAGAVLITGVKGRNPSKLKLWLLVEIILICIFSLDLITLLITFSGNWEEVLIQIFAVVFSFFGLWVVNVHRQELLGFSGGEVGYDRNPL